jgi:replicative superfamily II helicase
MVLAMLRMFRMHPENKKIVYVAPFESICANMHKELSKAFKHVGRKVAMLTG